LQLATSVALAENEAGAAALVAMEAATNILNHAGRGEILLRAMEDASGVEILALDKGPGMADVGACMRDGYSTRGSSGTGLGAIERLSSRLEIYSRPEKGTALLAQVRKRFASRSAFEIGAISLPKPGEEVCGDGWAAKEGRGTLALLLVDGLGHGPGAAQAAREAERIFREAGGVAPTDALERMHAALRSTRGAAAGVAEVDCEGGRVKFAGVGNVAGFVLGSGTRRAMVSHNGTLGAAIRKLQEFTYPWPADGLVLLHSDGIHTSWNLDAYPGLEGSHAALIAGVLYRDQDRGRDDATVVVARAERRT
jgi:anti-sigma regulatory factor (Ser/Thr protein kinase)